MKLTLINTNRMTPPIAPVGLEYTAAAALRDGLDVQLLDLGLVKDVPKAIRGHFASRQPQLVGLSLRNVDDCFWPSGTSFVPEVEAVLAQVRQQCDAPIVLGGVGFSIFPRELVARTGVEFGVHGDGEIALVELARQLQNGRRFDRVRGLVWRDETGELRANPPAWPPEWPADTRRDLIDNRTYFRLGAQIGVETKRGCHRQCLYCADPLAKGASGRLRDPASVADEFAALAARGIDVAHICDAEFNLPRRHAVAVCEELIRRGLGTRVRWYAYLAVTPCDDELADRMARAGCVGINFTGDAASADMLATYRQPHARDDLRAAARRCRQNGIAVMFDLLLGGPGETPETAAETIGFLKQIEPDCVGAALGVRLYPRTAMIDRVAAEGPIEHSPAIRRRYSGAIDLVQPTFYISPLLGPRPARVIRALIGGDARFFEPAEEPGAETGEGDTSGDHNYHDNRALVEAIAAGHRGAYWDILRRLRGAG